MGGTFRNLGPSDESVEKPETSSSVSGGQSSRRQASSRKTESEPSERSESCSGGSTLPIEARGARRDEVCWCRWTAAAAALAAPYSPASLPQGDSSGVGWITCVVESS